MRGFGSGSTGAAIGSDGGGSLGALVIGVASGADVGVRTGVHATSTMHDAITRAERTQAFLHRTVARAMGRRWAAPRPAILRAPSRRAMLGPERAAFAHGGFVARGRPLALVFRYQLHRPLLTMSVPNNERPWAPAELDALEDALESLAQSDVLPSTLAPEQQQRIAERLASYRAIAGLSRELLTAHVAPPRAIAAAIAEAHASVQQGAGAGPVAAPHEPTVSWWSRAKRLWLVPALASAGVGALVVVLSIDASKPDATMVAADTPARSEAALRQESAPTKADAKASQPLAMAEPREDGDAKSGFELDGTARGAAAEAAPEETRGRLRDRQLAAEEGEAQRRQGGAELEEAATKNEKKKKEVVADDKPKDQPASPDPAPPAEPKAPTKSKPPATKPSKTVPSGGLPGASGGGGADVSPAAIGDILVRADRARRSGDCAAARRDYDIVIDRGDRKQRARAKAGTALCLEREGAEASAADLIAGARQDDPDIDGWIADERGASK